MIIDVPLFILVCVKAALLDLSKLGNHIIKVCASICMRICVLLFVCCDRP